jgi:HEAT repeat protein
VAAIIKILGGKSLTLLGAREQENLYAYMLAGIEDDDHEVQDVMIRGLSFFRQEGATEAILRLSMKLDPDRDHERLLMMAEALSKIGYNPALERALRSGSELAVHLAVEVLSRVPDHAAVAAMKDVFWDYPRDLQRAIIAALATQCLPEDQDFFLDVLGRHNDGTVLKSALLFLGRKGEPSEVGESVAGFLDYPYDDVKEAALDACIALHDPVITGYLLSMSAEADPLRRMMAVYALAAIDLSAYRHIVGAALNDAEENVRKIALEALDKQSPLAAEYLELVEGMLDDPSSDVRLLAITVLGHGDERRLVPHLLKGLDDPDPWVRVRCIETIGRLRIMDAAPRLIELLASDNELILIKAVEALGAIGGEVAFRSLFILMDHENPEVQQAAEEAIERIRSGEGA